MAIQSRRGLEIDFDPNKLISGEYAGTLDTKKAFYAFAPGDVKQLSTYEDMKADIEQAQEEITDALTEDINLVIAEANTSIDTINQTNTTIQAEEATRQQQELDRQANTATAIQNTDDATDRANQAADDVNSILLGSIATDTTLGVVEGSGDVKVNPITGSMTVPKISQEIDNIFYINPSILKIPLPKKYRGWQGVAVHDNLIYAFTDRGENFGLENIISTYSLDGNFVSETRNAYTGVDSDGKFMSFGDGNIIGEFVFITAYNCNSGGNPWISRVIKYDILNLSINQVYDIGNNIAESVTKHDGFFWVVYHDVTVVRKFDLEFNFLQEYNLTIDNAPHGYFQGSLWEGNIFYANLHGHNTIESMEFSQLRKYEFTGTEFNFIESLSPPTVGCGQGISKYGKYYFWNDRPKNMIIISKDIKAGNVYTIDAQYQNEDSYKPTLLNDWVPYDLTSDRTARVTFRDGVVYLSGIIKNTRTDVYDGFTRIFQLPYQYRPKFNINAVVLTDKGIVRINVVAKNASAIDGDVYVQNIMEHQDISWLSLDGINFPILD